MKAIIGKSGLSTSGEKGRRPQWKGKRKEVRKERALD